MCLTTAFSFSISHYEAQKNLSSVASIYPSSRQLLAHVQFFPNSISSIFIFSINSLNLLLASDLGLFPLFSLGSLISLKPSPSIHLSSHFLFLVHNSCHCPVLVPSLMLAYTKIAQILPLVSAVSNSTFIRYEVLWIW